MGKPLFDPVPVRAKGDRRLTGLACRVLMAIAGHDRFNRNGRGCYAGHQTLARECQTDLKNLWEAIQTLVEFGYITEETDPKDGRRRIYRTIYDQQDTRSTDRISPMGIGGLGAVNLAGDTRSGAPQNGSQPFENKQDGKPNILVESLSKRYSLESAPNLGRQLGEFERALRTVSQKPKGKRDDAWLCRWSEALTEFVDQTQHGETNHHWAERLLNEVTLLLEEPEYQGQGAAMYSFVPASRTANGSHYQEDRPEMAIRDTG